MKKAKQEQVRAWQRELAQERAGQRGKHSTHIREGDRKSEFALACEREKEREGKSGPVGERIRASRRKSQSARKRVRGRQDMVREIGRQEGRGMQTICSQKNKREEG